MAENSPFRMEGMKDTEIICPKNNPNLDAAIAIDSFPTQYMDRQADSGLARFLTDKRDGDKRPMELTFCRSMGEPRWLASAFSAPDTAILSRWISWFDAGFINSGSDLAVPGAH
ncbi:hypothetical protein EMCG_02358 [[Emmonsia] crescens]|uniref:Uncharacterized protein n=1 Tax=[Emmonsia] crescens TaxID=73230 RepID=A0A0G2HYG8_9EURO|nr:hypothetical protein EMCG_02358 [Emmonsia crescens UAMH 3008]